MEVPSLLHPPLPHPTPLSSPNPAALSAAAPSTGCGSRSSQETRFGCRGAMEVGNICLVMSVGGQELKPPCLGAGAPQGPLEDRPALGEDGCWGDGAVGRLGRTRGWALGGAHAIQLILLADRPDLHLGELE